MVFLIVSVPLLVINRFLCWIAKVVDNEFYPLSRPQFATSVQEMLTVLNSSISEGVLIGGDFHHYSKSRIRDTNLWSVVSSGMTAKSLTSTSVHGSLLFWATSLFPGSVGPFKSEAPQEIFLGKNFVVIERGSDGRLTVRPTLDEKSVEGWGSVVNWMVGNLHFEHYVTFLAVLVVWTLKRIAFK